MRTDRKFDVSHLKFDKRLLEINFKNKSLSQEDYQKHLEGLADQSDNAGKVKLFEVEEKIAPTIDPSDPLASSLSATPYPDSNSGSSDGGGDQGGGGHTPFGGGF